MNDACDELGLEQKVRQPTREDNLLDLVLTDIPQVRAKVLPKIADHKGVLVELSMPEILEKTVSREVWILSKANWPILKDDLKNYDWHLLK